MNVPSLSSSVLLRWHTGQQPFGSGAPEASFGRDGFAATSAANAPWSRQLQAPLRRLDADGDGRYSQQEVLRGLEGLGRGLWALTRFAADVIGQLLRPMPNPIAPPAGPIAPPAAPIAPPSGPIAPPAGPIAPPAGPSAGPRAIQLAWNYKPPKDGTPVETLAKNMSLMVLTGRHDVGYVQKVRAAGFEGPILNYILACEVEGPWGAERAGQAVDASYQPWDNNAASKVGAFAREIHPHEDWFLHDQNGKRIVGSNHGRAFYVMNPASPGWRAYAAANMREAMRTLPYDGVFLDNVELSLSKIKRETGAAPKEYADDASYRKAWLGFLAEMSSVAKSEGKSLWGNVIESKDDGSDWNAYMQYLDGGMNEDFAIGWRDDWKSPETWENDLKQAEWLLANGKAQLSIANGHLGASRPDLHRFALASHMLITDGKEAYFRYGSAYASYIPLADYAKDLGAPLGPRYRVGEAWRRDFERGYVEVNPVRHTARIEQARP